MCADRTPRLALPFMTPEDLEGLVIGPVTHRVDRERVDAFVDVTGDAPDRWVAFAPPGYASVLLFAVARDLLTDERIAAYLTTLIHVDQQFAYPAPIAVDATVAMTGTVQRVRERSGAYFVTLDATGTVDDVVVLESHSTFLMSAVPASGDVAEEDEPPVHERGNGGPAAPFDPEVTVTDRVVERSASRSDLVRYAAATGDFNPLHWDHETAVRAGLPGVVVHGLLMLTWFAQTACAYGPGPNPVSTIKVRFKNALRPAGTARIEVTAGSADPAKLAMRLSSADRDVATATVVLGRSGVTD